MQDQNVGIKCKLQEGREFCCLLTAIFLEYSSHSINKCSEHSVNAIYYYSLYLSFGYVPLCWSTSIASHHANAHVCTHAHKYAGKQVSLREYSFKYLLNRLRMTLQGRLYYPHFSDEESEAIWPINRIISISDLGLQIPNLSLSSGQLKSCRSIELRMTYI